MLRPGRRVRVAVLVVIVSSRGNAITRPETVKTSVRIMVQFLEFGIQATVRTDR
jgi:hypothetical protein